MPDNIKNMTQSPRVHYQADGRNTYEYSFDIFNHKNLVVYVDEKIQPTSDYTITLDTDTSGGTVTFITPPKAGHTVTLMRQLNLERTTDFQEGGALRATALNHELDYQMACMQQVSEQASRAVLYPPSAPQLANDLFLPLPNAGKSLMWNAAGTALENSDIEVNTLTRTMEESINTVLEQTEIAKSSAATATAEIDRAAEKIADVTEQVALVTQQVQTSAEQITTAITQANTASAAATTATEQATLASQKAKIAETAASTATEQATLSSQKAEIATTQANRAQTLADTMGSQVTIASQKAEIATQKATTATEQAIIATEQAELAAEYASQAGGGSTSNADLTLSNVIPCQNFKNDTIKIMGPDFARGINLTMVTEINGSANYTTPCAGWVKITANNYSRLDIDNVIYASGYTYEALVYYSTFVPAGSLIRPFSMASNKSAVFYPCKGAVI